MQSLQGGDGDVPELGARQAAALGQGRLLRESEDSVGEAPPPIREALLQPPGALIRQDFLNAEGDFRDRHGRQSQFGVMLHQPGQHSRVRRFPQGFRDHVGVEEDQSSRPVWTFRSSRITASRSISVPQVAESRS